MSIRNLGALFNPKSIAVIGAAERDNSPGAIVMRNLLQGGFSGPIMPVNPKAEAVAGVLAYRDVQTLPLTPDLAVIAVPAREAREQVARLGARGTRAAVVLSSGMGAMPMTEGGVTALEELRLTAEQYDMRILGPSSLGLIVPGNGLNASYAQQPAHPGRIAFVSQSGALCNAVLDWARPKGIGFSHFISVGEAVDIGFGDLLDYLGSDPQTRAILIYMESIRQRRNFMSAARAAARNKPVLAIKAGRKAESARATASHTGALAGADAVYDAALRRAGMLRVYDLDEMFTAVETLSRARPMRGRTLAMLTNGGGFGVMAVDELVEAGGQLAEFSTETATKLKAAAPKGGPVNPVHIAAGNDEGYLKALEVLLDAPEVDAVLALHVPNALSEPAKLAGAVVKTHQAHRGNIMTCWVGQETEGPARRLLREAGIPTYETPSAAVRAFMHLVDYRKNQDMLMETPPSALADFVPDIEAARAIIDKALAAGSAFLSEAEAKAVLTAYGIPTVETRIARTPAEAGMIAGELDCAVALKIHSRDIGHKSDVDGVVLNLQGVPEVEKAATQMLERVRLLAPSSELNGFTVQPMARNPGAHELIIGVTTDPIFGPVIIFGQGGVAVEVINDSAVGLPPLNMTLARELVSRTRIANLLKGCRNRPGVNLDAVCLSLMKISQLIIDLPEIIELDVNPLFADAQGVLALDARIRLGTLPPAPDRLAIRPYPKSQEETFELADGRMVMLRPIRPEDEPNHHVFVSRLTPEDVRFRFFGLVGELPHTEMARLTQIDYDREMAFVATLPDNSETLGVVRTVSDPDNERAEFAVLVRSDLKGSGLGRKLMLKMIRYCRSRGTGQIVGQILTENTRMLRFVESLGFRRERYVENDIIEVVLDLRAPPPGGQTG